MTQAFKLPDLGEGIHEAEIQNILVAVGDDVQEEQIILLIETDKAVVEMPSPYRGAIAEICVAIGDRVQVGEVLMTFGNGREATPEAAGQPQRLGRPVTAPTTAATSHIGAREPHKPPASLPASERRVGPVPASPATRRLARQLGVDLHQVPASGPAGQVTAEDVQAFAKHGAEQTEIAAAPEAHPETTPSTRPSLEPEALPDFSRWA